MQNSSRVSAMEMMRGNEKHNFKMYHESQSTSTVSTCNLVKQLRPSVSPRANGRRKVNRTETRPIQRKKQVRRRIHTTKPYQERLLNMAEARKEIVSALKLHRASMKKQQQQQQTGIVPALMHQIPSEQKQHVVIMSTLMHQIPLEHKQPQQPNFMNPDYPTTYQDHYTNLNATDHLGPSEEDQCSNSGGRCEGGAVEPRALDEEEMAEIRSIGEMHQMEWDDTLNLATYALWFKFLQEMELSE